MITRLLKNMGVAIILLISSSSYTYGQLKHDLGIDLLHSIASRPTLSYELTFKESFSLWSRLRYSNLSQMINYRDPLTSMDTIYRYRQQRVEFMLGAKYYFSKSNHRKLWLGLYWSNEWELSRGDGYREWSLREFNEEIEVDTWQGSYAGLALGYKWIIRSRLFIDLGLSIDVNIQENINREAGIDARWAPLLVVGYRFGKNTSGVE